jgi:uncharacterized protein (TIGR03437 family)
MKPGSRARLVLVGCIGTLLYAQPSLQYVTGDATAQARVLAADASGNIFTVLNVVEPSGKPQMRVVKTSIQGTTVGTFDFGGSSTDTPSGAVTDTQGNLVIVGTTTSADFPTVSRVDTPTDPQVAFVTKINSQLTQILFSTRLGGSEPGSTAGNAIALDSAGNMYVTGSTSAHDFPITSGAFQPQIQPSFSPPFYAYVTEIASVGYKIVYSTFYGGSQVNCNGGSSCISPTGVTSANAIAVDASGAAMIAGSTNATNLPVTSGTPGQTCVCIIVPLNYYVSAGFIAKLAPGGSRLTWATYVDFTTDIFQYATLAELNEGVTIDAVSLDSGGNVIVGGSAGSNFPTTAGVLQPAFPSAETGANPTAGFVSKYSANGQQILFSTFLGGSPGVAALGIDSQGTIWLTGSSPIAALPLPTSTPALGTSYVVGLSSDGTQLLSGFSAPAGAAGQGIVITAQGSAVALGISGSLLTESGGQRPAIAGIVNSAGVQTTGQVTPYELVSLYGYGIGASAPLSGQITNGVLGTSLGGFQVSFDGIPAPLLYVGPNQINAIVPGEIAGRTTTVLQVTEITGGSQTLPLFVIAVQPQIFADASGMAFALNQDGTVNSATNPAPGGTVVAVWATGAGAYAVPEADGKINGSTSLQQPLAPVSIQSNAAAASSFAPLPVPYAGDAPDLVAGVIQVNFRLPNVVLQDEIIVGAPLTAEIELQAGTATGSICAIYVVNPLAAR